MTTIPLPLLRALPAGRTPPETRAVRRADDLPRRLIDSHGRTVRNLRLSITDRCNFRCVYCMAPDAKFAPQDSHMSVGELLRVTQACVDLGVERIRLTGGEPTVHPRLTQIIRGVAALRSRIDGRAVREVSMTTNGSLVTAESLAEWKAAGLTRITFSLDAVTPEVFDAMSRSCGQVAKVIDAIRLAMDAGFAPVKVNAVVLRGVNEQEVAALARLARQIGFEMRFIEYMPLDSGRNWDATKLVSADEILALASQAGDLVALGRDESQSTSEMYCFKDQPEARLGVIAPVTRPFCGACSRLRITSDGKVRPCLFSLDEFDLMPLLRPVGHSSKALEDAILDAVWTKQSGHGIGDSGFHQPERSMSAIGG